MNTLLTLVEEPLSPDRSLGKMEHAIETAVQEIAAGEDGLSSEGSAPTVALAAVVKLATNGSSADETVNGGEKPWRWAEGWWAVKKCSARLFSC